MLEYPVLFTKLARSLTGPYDPIPCPPESTAIDYEGELAVVIGEPARRVARTEALSEGDDMRSSPADCLSG